MTFPALIKTVTATAVLFVLSGCSDSKVESTEVSAAIETGSDALAMPLMDMTGGKSADSKHSHGMLDVTDWIDQTGLPAVQINVERDPMAGWNVQLTTENFRFSPEAVNTAPVPGEGHAHIYVDGYKFARVYGSWYHLKNLTSGEHTITVTLNANNHGRLGYQQKPISAQVVVSQ